MRVLYEDKTSSIAYIQRKKKHVKMLIQVSWCSEREKGTTLNAGYFWERCSHSNRSRRSELLICIPFKRHGQKFRRL